MPLSRVQGTPGSLSDVYRAVQGAGTDSQIYTEDGPQVSMTVFKKTYTELLQCVRSAAACHPNNLVPAHRPCVCLLHQM